MANIMVSTMATIMVIMVMTRNKVGVSNNEGRKARQ